MITELDKLDHTILLEEQIISWWQMRMEILMNL